MAFSLFAFYYLCSVISPGKRLLFGLKVRQLRQERQLSFAELATRSGLSLSFLNEIERGKKYPRPEKLRELARGLECSPQWLASDDPGPHLAPVAALLQSKFLNELPLELFGIDSTRVLELLSNAPLQVNAFVSSLVELAQDHALGTDHFYLSAMRAYQELNNNYFPDLEQAARDCRQQFNLPVGPLQSSHLKRILINHFGVKLLPGGLRDYPELQHLRSVFIPSKKELLLHPHLTEEQLLFQLSKEIGFQFLALDPRPFASTVQQVRSFTQVLHNFKAGYFAVALLLEEHDFLARLETAFHSETFDPQLMLQWLEEYKVSPDVLFQRFNVIAPHWGIDNVFFHRLTYSLKENKYVMDKELHLHRNQRRYAGRSSEQYCRRWLSSRLIQQLVLQKDNGPLTGLTKARFEDNKSWLCLGVARKSTTHPETYTGLMIGVLLKEEERLHFPFASQPHIFEEQIGLTCERCPIVTCTDRAAPPTVLEYLKKRQRIYDQLKSLTG